MNRVLVPPLAALPRVPQGALSVLAGTTMGTSWSVRGYAAPAAAAWAEPAINALLDDIVQQMSQWAPDSCLSHFNALALGESLQLPQTFGAVLACALAVAADTDGAFDPTIGALVDLWGFGALPTAGVEPAPMDIAAALSATGWRKLDFDTAARRLTQPGGLRLDLAGIAKGYAVDRVARLLCNAGFDACLVEIGGELRGIGVKPDGQPWWVDIECPPGSTAPPLRVALCNLSIATSGDYRRSVQANGRQRSHTIDPRTGWPLQSAVASVTVLHADCMLADAWATALMVLGPATGLALAKRRGLMAMFTLRTAQGIVERYSPAFATSLAAESRPEAPASRSNCRQDP